MKSMHKRSLIGLIAITLLLGVAPLSSSASDKEPKRVKTPRERLAERSFPNVTIVKEISLVDWPKAEETGRGGNR
jgi:hypothetical protein